MSAQQQPSSSLQNLSKNIPYLDRLSKNGDIAFALAIFGILFVLLFPIAPILLDILLAVSIATSVLVLLTSLFILRPLDFNVFPTLLLVTAMMRLSLNIASTRLILSHGSQGTAAAGHIIEAFGNFVMEGNVVIGAIVFIILTIINFVVITKGSGRIAEVAARFSLDAMPGKQMAIDADLSAGLIDEATAKTRRKDLEDESTFFGSMDGANKFVRGDAIAGILITFINFVAGIIIGVAQQGMSFKSALNTYTTLTIGDGLVTQIPALIVSLAAGLLVSKSGAVGSTDQVIVSQLSKNPKAIGLSSVITTFMALMPGVPATPFLLISLITGLIAWSLRTIREEAKNTPQSRTAQGSAAQNTSDGQAGSPATATQEDTLSEVLHIDSIRLELGYALLPLINYTKGAKLTEQIKALRKQMAKDLGFIIPAVRIQDNLQLPNYSYSIKIKEIECARGDVKTDMLLIMDPKGGEIRLQGENTTEPAFGLPAKWVQDSSREEAMSLNYTVVDPPTVIATHLTEVIKDNITELLSYSETQKLLDGIASTHKKLISETIPSQITVSGVQRVLQNLLAEAVSIRDLPSILEAISEVSRNPNINLTQITEHVRSRLARQISHAYMINDEYIPIITLSPAWEQLMLESLSGTNNDKIVAMPPSKLQEFINALRKILDDQAHLGHVPVLLVNPAIRPYLRSMMERFKSSIAVLSQNEIHPRAKIKTLSVLQ